MREFDLPATVTLPSLSTCGLLPANMEVPSWTEGSRLPGAVQNAPGTSAILHFARRKGGNLGLFKRHCSCSVIRQMKASITFSVLFATSIGFCACGGVTNQVAPSLPPASSVPANSAPVRAKLPVRPVAPGGLMPAINHSTTANVGGLPPANAGGAPPASAGGAPPANAGGLPPANAAGVPPANAGRFTSPGAGGSPSAGAHNPAPGQPMDPSIFRPNPPPVYPSILGPQNSVRQPDVGPATTNTFRPFSNTVPPYANRVPPFTNRVPPFTNVVPPFTNVVPPVTNLPR